MKGFGDLYKDKKKKNKPPIEQIINQAIQLHLQGNITEASKYYKQLINQGCNNPSVFSNYGAILYGLGKLNEAENSFRKAIEINPSFADAYSNLGNILQDLGKLHEAEISTRKATELNPDSAGAHLNLGIILRNLGKLHEAEISTRKAIELDPDFAKAHTNLGNILIDQGKLQEAEISTRKAIELDPDFPDAYFTLGNILRDLGKLKELLLLSKSTIKLRSVNKEYKILASLRITITNLLQKDFSETLVFLKNTKDLMSQEAINSIENKKNKTYLFAYYRFISSLYPLLEKSNKYPDSNPIPHFGESHCLSFAHQTLNISTQINRIQPVLISGGKAWHFANNKNNQWKNSLTEQMKNHNYSDKVFISFGEIDCRKKEGILNYSYKKNKDISKVCEATINGYLNYMEKVLSPNYSERYYFGVPAPTIEEKLLDDFDKKRIKLVELYNLILKKEVLSKGSYFVDVYKLTTNKDGLNNNIYMCDNIHLSPKCLSILFENYLDKS